MNENNDEYRDIMKNAKRNLGDGRWDKILKKKMVELSVADNYDEAKYEWKATGEVWWQVLELQDLLGLQNTLTSVYVDTILYITLR